MRYCGIDLGGLSSYAFVTDERGTKQWSGAVAVHGSGSGRRRVRSRGVSSGIRPQAGGSAVVAAAAAAAGGCPAGRSRPAPYRAG